MRNFLIGILALLASTNSYAGSFFKYGLGMFGSAEYGAATVKYFGFGYEDKLIGPFIEQYELGLFVDTSGHDRKGSGFGFYSIGVESNPGYFVLRSTFGLGAITSPDAMLGGRFQFTEDLFLGVRDDRGCMIGIDLKHISSAGIEQPNAGRDFAVVQVEIPW